MPLMQDTIVKSGQQTISNLLLQMFGSASPFAWRAATHSSLKSAASRDCHLKAQTSASAAFLLPVSLMHGLLTYRQTHLIVFSAHLAAWLSFSKQCAYHTVSAIGLPPHSCHQHLFLPHSYCHTYFMRAHTYTRYFPELKKRLYTGNFFTLYY